MSIPDAVAALVEVTAGDRSLLPVWKAGEHVTIQRDVNGQNVLMWCRVEDPCTLGPTGMVLRAKIVRHGVSSYADGRVANQHETITRLMEERKRILELAIAAGATEIVDIIVTEA